VFFFFSLGALLDGDDGALGVFVIASHIYYALLVHATTDVVKLYSGVLVFYLAQQSNQFSYSHVVLHCSLPLSFFVSLL
jgi:hypothetical protein